MNNRNVLQPPPISENIEDFRNIVNKYFRVYDIRLDENVAAFHFSMDKVNFGTQFDVLRRELILMGYIPRTVYEHGEYIIYVMRKPKVVPRSVKVNWILFILTIFSTTWAGSVWWILYVEPGIEFNNAMFKGFYMPEYLLYGAIFFALPLMLILGIHELGHYFVAKKHGVDASLPFFIPVPPPLMLGTMGAFISMREPIPNKKALLDIGAAGPICGFLVALPVLVIGLILTSSNPSEIPEVYGDFSVINFPLLFYGLVMVFPLPEDALLHPTAFAGWVGLLVTALNLLPGGQLDGGHISRALFGKFAKYISYGTVILLIIMTFTTGFMAWLFFAFIIMILGTQHPPPLEDLSKLDVKRKAIGVCCIIMLFICIHPTPIEVVTISPEKYNLSFECDDSENVVDIGGHINYSIVLNYTGEGEKTGFFRFEPEYINSNSSYWEIEIILDGNIIDISEQQTIQLSPDRSIDLNLDVATNRLVDYGDKLIINISAKLGNKKETFNKLINTTVSTINLNAPTQLKKVFPGNIVPCNITVRNFADQWDAVSFQTNPIEPGWYLEVEVMALNLAPHSSGKLEFEVRSPENASTGDKIIINITGISNNNSSRESVMIVIIII